MRSRSLALLIFPLLAACQKSEAPAQPAEDASAAVAIAPKGRVLQAAENDEDEETAKPRTAKAAANDKVEVAAGSFEAGSTPGDKGRSPMLEPADLKIELGAFSIDRSLYPNQPNKPALTGVSRARAADLCGKVGGRLCTELEWERACKGPEGQTYAGGATWDATCATQPGSCASGFGVLDMGAYVREWTSSDIAPIEKLQSKAASVRGAATKADASEHRCANRSPADPASSSDDLGFRCCYGPPNAAVIASPKYEQTFRRADISPAQVAEMLASVPQLKGISSKITYYKEPDDVSIVLSRGGVTPPEGTTFTTQPILWNPIPGEEILVVAGRAEKDSFIVAFYRLPEDRYRIASTLLLVDDVGPVVLGYSAYVRRKLMWGTAWDKPTESGNITYRDDNRVVITQK